MCSLLLFKEQYILLRERIQNGFFFSELCPVFNLDFLISSIKHPTAKHIGTCMQCSCSFLATLAEGQRAFVMALCPSSVRPSVRVCVCKLFLQKTSSQKLLIGFLRNFTGTFHRWSSFKFLQIVVFYEKFWLPWRSK